MIKVEHLSHSYNDDNNYAVKDISFHVKKGEIFGFLGPSGAGKSTTQNILTGLLALKEGKVLVNGIDIKKEDKNRFNEIGVSFEQSNLYSKLSAIDNLKYYAELFDVETRNPLDLIKSVGLEGKEKLKVKEYSKGMKHRLTFARSLINNPKLWFLDEPTTGLDPAISSSIKDIIREENQKGTTVFLTTHNMQIAEELCDRVAFIVDGEIKLIDTPKNLKLKYGKKEVDVEYRLDNQIVKESLNLLDKVAMARLNEITTNYEVITMHTAEASLEEIFVKVTGKVLNHENYQ